MASVNKVIIIGNLGSDPDVKKTTAGQPVANLSVATSEKWTDKTGNAQEKTEWHRIVVWGRLAENCGKYLKKGRPVYVEGKLQTREYPDPRDNTQKKYITEIIANQVLFLSSSSPDNRTNEVQSDSPLPNFNVSSFSPENNGFPSGNNGFQNTGNGARLDDDIPF